MNQYKWSLFIVLLMAILLSCSYEKKLAKIEASNEKLVNYLTSVINDTTFYEVSALTIIDNGIYPVLDSVISWSEKCQYFDAKIKFLNCFRIGLRYENETILYSIEAHLSPAQALGLFLVQNGVIDKIQSKGGFYYKNFLFIVPLKITRLEKVNSFPFIDIATRKIKIRAPEFFDEKDYISYITFRKENNRYKIQANNLCGNELLIK